MIKSVLNPEIKERLINDQMALAIIAVNIGKEVQTVKANLKNGSPMFCQPHFQMLIRKALKLEDNEEIVTIEYSETHLHE